MNMKITVRNFTYIIFAIVVSIVFIANFFSPDLKMSYWLLLAGFSILLIWILIKSVSEKTLLLFCISGMLAGSILVKFDNLIAIVLGAVFFCVGILFFVFRRVE